MTSTLTILTLVGTVGAIDVLYYHLYRFRLFAQDGSVAQEITHLLRHAIFVAVLVLCMRPPEDSLVMAVMLLFALDMANSVADVLLERRSRAALGGLPSAEYLLHVLSSFGMGVAVASYALASPSASSAPEGLLLWQVRAMVVAGVLLFCVEAALFGRALAERSRATVPLGAAH